MSSLLVTIFLSFCYLLYTGQLQMAVAIILFYAIGRFILLVFNSPERRRSNVLIYDVCFFSYGILALLTQILLIKNPYIDYYIHYDASHSFFAGTMREHYNVNLFKLIKAEIKVPGSQEYFFARWIFSKLAHLAQALGIEDVRLFLRIHVYMLASLIPSIMYSMLFQYGINDKNAKKRVLVFSFCSYLFITSCIYSRDLHICFFYTVAAYVFLIPECRYRNTYLFILCLLTYGFRQENGILLIILLISNWYIYLKNRNAVYLLYLPLVLMVIFSLSYILLMLDTSNQFHEKNMMGNSSTGLFMKFYTLPFPINTVIMVVYMLLQPLPIFFYVMGNGNTWLTLPFVLSPYLMVAGVIGCLWYLSENKARNQRVTVMILLSLLMFVGIIQGSPDLRRAFAAIPGLFMCYFTFDEKVSYKYKYFTYNIFFPILLILSVLLSIYVYI